MRSKRLVLRDEIVHFSPSSSPTLASKFVKATQKCLSLLDQSHTMSQIKQLQSHLTVAGTLKDPYAAGKIISFCAVSHNGDLPHAYKLFLRLQYRSTFIWNTMIRGFVERNEPKSAAALHREMLRSGFVPNNYSFSFLLRAYTDTFDVPLGIISHAQVVRLGWESHEFVLNALVHFYVTCGCMDAARRLFDMSSNRDVVTWTSMISGFCKSGQFFMARKLFDEMPERNSVSWSAMITGYVQVRLFEEALEIFNAMLKFGFQPIHSGIVGALIACAFLGSLDQGRWIHSYVNRNKIAIDKVLGAALINMYAKCGCMDTACRLFDKIPSRDVYTFTCLISGLANHGRGATAIELFNQMQNEGIVPNEVTFICVLNACSQSGLVDEGLRIFRDMTKSYGVEPRVEHYGCLVDLLGRAGRLEEAKTVVREMPMEPDSYVLGALLNACRVSDNVELGKEVVKSLVQHNLDHDGKHVLLSNLYASTNRWYGVEEVRKEMEVKKVRKVPGCSSIGVNGIVYEFVAGDRSLVFMEEIMFLLRGIDKHLCSPFDYGDNYSFNNLPLLELTFSQPREVVSLSAPSALCIKRNNVELHCLSC